MIATPGLSPTNEREPYTQDQITEIWFSHHHLKEKYEKQLHAKYPEADRELIEAAVFGGLMNMWQAAARCENRQALMVCRFKAYLWMCIKNKYLDLVIQEKRLKLAMNKIRDLQPDPRLLHRRQTEREEAHDFVAFARSMLSIEDFDLLRLHYVEGWAPSLIAEETGVSSSTVRRRIAVIVDRVRESYELRLEGRDTHGQVKSM